MPKNTKNGTGCGSYITIPYRRYSMQFIMHFMHFVNQNYTILFQPIYTYKDARRSN